MLLIEREMEPSRLELRIKVVEFPKINKNRFLISLIKVKIVMIALMRGIA